MKKDLTRWNRAGLETFRYLDGNAVTYLDTLRQGMVEAFTDGGTLRWQDLAQGLPEDASEREIFDAMLSQYHRGERGDYAWEILRSFARSIHILTEHLDAFSNESSLRTAKEWEHLRRLVEMIDYRPAPPASAATELALIAKEEKTGPVAAGFQVKNEPTDGSKAVIFETLEALEVDSRLNAMKARDWNHSREQLQIQRIAEDQYQTRIPLSKPLEDVSVGSLGLLVMALPTGEFAIAVKIVTLRESEVIVRWKDEIDLIRNIEFGDLSLRLSPQRTSAPKLAGNRVIELDGDFSLTSGRYVAWQNEAEGWILSKVVASEGRRILLDHSAPSAGAEIIHVGESIRQSNGKIIVPTERAVNRVWDESLNAVSIVHYDKDNHVTNSRSQSIRDEASTSGDKVLYLYQDEALIGHVRERHPQTLEFEGSAEDLESESWFIIHSQERRSLNELPSTFTAKKIRAITAREENYEVDLVGHGDLSPNALYTTNFSLEIKPRDFDADYGPVDQKYARSSFQSLIDLELIESPELLEKGRILIARSSEFTRKLVVKDVITLSQGPRVVVEPALDDHFTRFETEFFGNIVRAGHGESKPVKTLGSGDATQTNQEMILGLADVAFIQDPAMPSGVRAAVEVVINSRTWQQVPNFQQSEQEDAHYTVRLTEDGQLLFTFGDGFQARRLPTGRNNVTVHSRVGTGLSGNLFAGGLTKAVKPHRLLENFIHLEVTSGGNDREDESSLHTNAPKSLLALERAVSLNDFAALAASHSGIWQAKAFRLQPGFGHSERVRVALVPAGGGPLGSLEDEIRDFLKSHAVPGVEVQVVPYRAVALDLEIMIQVKSAEYDPDTVIANVETALIASLSLQKRRLGAPLFRSEVYAIVEAVTGVENCQCLLSAVTAAGVRLQRGSDHTIRSIRPKADQVLFLDPSISPLSLSSSEFSL